MASIGPVHHASPIACCAGGDADAVCALADDVVLEVEQLEAGEEVLDEGADGEGQLEVAEGDGVCGEAGEVLGEVDEGEEVLFYGDVEGVAVFEVGGD